MLERPWARVKTPTPIPDRVDAEFLSALDDRLFAELVRDNLMPRTPSPPDRERWEALWSAVATDDDLADQTLDVLEAFLDAVDELRARGDGDPNDLRRASKFERSVTRSCDRIESFVPTSEPLSWAGRRARKFNPASRAVIDQLVQAVAEHRRITGEDVAGDADQELWQVLTRVKLDPEQR